MKLGDERVSIERAASHHKLQDLINNDSEVVPLK